MTDLATVFSQRRHLLQAEMAKIEQKIVWLLANPSDIEYFTGFQMLVPEEREAFLLVSSDQAVLIHASFSPPPVAQKSLHLQTGVQPTSLLSHLEKLCHQQNTTHIQVDMAKLTAEEWQAIQKTTWTLSPLPRQSIWKLRQRKDTYEITQLKKAGQIAAEVLAHLKPELSSRMTEIDVARRLEVLLLEHGSEKVAFPTIVAFGAHGALPHHQPTDTPLQPETAVLIDFGAMVHGYRSDMTRSWWFGEHPSSEFTKIEQLVRQAYQASLAVLSQEKPTAAAVDTAARQLIANAGFGSQFIHTTGHGVGLEIHEPPSIYHTSSQVLEPGMVITIEPGIYLEKNFGYRHENTVLVSATRDQKPLELTADPVVQ